ADKNIRNAIACSVNRTLAVREMDGFGLKAPLIFSRAWSYYDNSLEREEESDRAFTASEYLRKAGMMDFDKDGWLDFPDSSTETGYYCIVELTVTVHADSREKRLVANEMASFLNGIGLKTKVNELPWDKYEEAVKGGSCDIYLAEVRVPANFDFADILSSGGRLNYGGIDSDELDDLIDEFRSAAGEDKRSAAGRLALSVRDNAYIVPILYRQFAIHSQRNTIYGLIASPSSLFYNFSDWTFRLE
ncbi:MAG: hypothetical protein HUJ65_08170, partial [Oscillospiraceae bacterium]|nr:hypothetical protein [Oscillospiraceae bacterium]